MQPVLASIPNPYALSARRSGKSDPMSEYMLMQNSQAQQLLLQQMMNRNNDGGNSGGYDLGELLRVLPRNQKQQPPVVYAKGGQGRKVHHHYYKINNNANNNNNNTNANPYGGWPYGAGMFPPIGAGYGFGGPGMGMGMGMGMGGFGPGYGMYDDYDDYDDDDDRPPRRTPKVTYVVERTKTKTKPEPVKAAPAKAPPPKPAPAPTPQPQSKPRVKLPNPAFPGPWPLRKLRQTAFMVWFTKILKKFMDDAKGIKRPYIDVSEKKTPDPNAKGKSNQYKKITKIMGDDDEDESPPPPPPPKPPKSSGSSALANKPPLPTRILGDDDDDDGDDDDDDGDSRFGRGDGNSQLDKGGADSRNGKGGGGNSWDGRPRPNDLLNALDALKNRGAGGSASSDSAYRAAREAAGRRIGEQPEFTGKIGLAPYGPNGGAGNSESFLTGIMLKECVSALHNTYTNPNGHMTNILKRATSDYSNDFKVALLEERGSLKEAIFKDLDFIVEKLTFEITEIMPKNGILGTLKEESYINSLIQPQRTYPASYFWVVEKRMLNLDRNDCTITVSDNDALIILMGLFIGRALVTTCFFRPLEYGLTESYPTARVESNLRILASIYIYILRKVLSDPYATYIMDIPGEIAQYLFPDDIMQPMYDRLRNSIGFAENLLREWAKEYVRRLRRGQ